MSSAFDAWSGVSCVIDLEIGIERRQPLARGDELAAADVVRVVQNLALQVALVDDVEVHEPEGADAGRGEVERRRRPEPAGADADDLRRLQALLALDAHLGQGQVTAVADGVAAREHRALRRLSLARRSDLAKRWNRPRRTGRC